MDFEEFAAVYEAYIEQRDTDFKDRWNRTRVLAAILIQPHLVKGKRVTPENLLPLPWDKKKEGKKKRTITVEEQRRRMEQLVAELGDEMI